MLQSLIISIKKKNPWLIVIYFYAIFSAGLIAIPWAYCAIFYIPDIKTLFILTGVFFNGKVNGKIMNMHTGVFRSY